MKLIDGKSVLLGMGLGIIMTSIMGVIFFLGFVPQLSDSDIIAKAKVLGMVDKSEISDEIERNPDGSLAFIIKENETYTQISERLYKLGIIQSSIEFDIMIKKENLENSIKPGRYTMSLKDDTKSIIQKITQ